MNIYGMFIRTACLLLNYGIWTLYIVCMQVCWPVLAPSQTLLRTHSNERKQFSGLYRSPPPPSYMYTAISIQARLFKHTFFLSSYLAG